MNIMIPKCNSRNTALIVASIASFLTPFMGSAVNIALPTIGKEFEIDAILLSWIATIYLLASAMFLIPFGRLGDIYGRKKIFTYGIVIYTLSAFFLAISPTATLLILFRLLEGIGAGMIFGTGVAILTSVFPPGERGKALGINVAAVYLGLALGPFLGGLLTHHFGWRSIFMINIPLGMFVIVLIFWKLKGEWSEAKGEKFDVTGSIIYSITLVAIMYGFTSLPKPNGFLFIIAGVIGVVAFIKWESKVPSPMFNIRLFKKNTVFTFSNLAALINYSATFAVAFLLSLYLQYTKGLSPFYAGLILISQPLVQATFSPFAGKLSDRVEPRIVASAGMAVTTIGLILFTFVTENTSLEFIICCLVILGFGFALFSSPNTNAVMTSVKKRFYGVASSTIATMRILGMMLSMGIVMLIFSLFIGREQITPEFYFLFLTSLKIAFIIFSVMCFIGIFASLARGKVR